MDHSQLNPQYHRALRVSCLYGTILESNGTELQGFLTSFQNLKIASKSFVEIHTNLSNNRIPFLNNIHRSFNIILGDRIHLPPSLQIRPISVTLFNLWPRHYSTPTGSRGIDLSLVQALAKNLKFSFKFLPVALSINPKTLPNGTTVGIIPDVQNGVADIAICQLALTHNRYQMVDYAPILSEHDVALVGPVAKPKSAYEALILPFDHWIWVCLGISLVGSFLILASFKIYLNPDKSVSTNIYESFCLAIVPLIQESIPFHHFQVNGFGSMYCFLFLWMAMGLLLALAYKSTLLATMTMVNFNGVIDTPEEVLKTNLPVYVLSQSLMETALLESPRQIYRDIYDNNITPFGTALPLGMTPPDMTDNVDKGKAFMVSTRTTMMRQTKYVTFPESIFIGPTSWVGQKGSRFLDMISDPIMRLQSSGIVDKWFQDELHIVLRGRDNERIQARHQPINMSHMTPPFLLLVVTLIICIFLFLAETFCRRLKTWVNKSHLHRMKD
ncbi:hypothetical protein TCAL_14461 [Tigriopus californicus]|uniref:Ionotropic glutamate receptor C-terminal domain-containing protein n=2 Tax=Tigriopus californicus TaxID=6832 RepID=A0A553PSH4_TIGCA|nr:hypothetical protein TCAL_14461 [Tigriopus californicus]